MKINGKKVRAFTGGLLTAGIRQLAARLRGRAPSSASNESGARGGGASCKLGDLFKGVFFGVGSIGRRLDAIWKGKTFAGYVVQLTDPTSLRSAADALQKLDGNQKIAADVERAASSLSSESGPALAASIKDAIRLFDYDTIINRIANRDPAFFGRFRTEIRSGNQPGRTRSTRKGGTSSWPRSTRQTREGPTRSRRSGASIATSKRSSSSLPLAPRLQSW
jgi:hypothetical protein